MPHGVPRLPAGLPLLKVKAESIMHASSPFPAMESFLSYGTLIEYFILQFPPSMPFVVSLTFGEANYHLQFTPKYRRDVFLDEEVRALCRESFRTTCEGLGIGMEACEFGPDHVHLFVSGCRKYSVPYMAQRLKGASAYVIRHQLWDRVKGKLWGDSFWSDGYFYRSVGSTPQKPYGTMCRTARGSIGCPSLRPGLRSHKETPAGR